MIGEKVRDIAKKLEKIAKVVNWLVSSLKDFPDV